MTTETTDYNASPAANAAVERIESELTARYAALHVMALGSNGVACLDGYYTAEELRAIAQALDDIQRAALTPVTAEPADQAGRDLRALVERKAELMAKTFATLREQAAASLIVKGLSPDEWRIEERIEPDPDGALRAVVSIVPREARR